MGRKNNIALLHDTLHILEKGYYKINGKKVHLKLSEGQMTSARVFLPRRRACSKSVNSLTRFTSFGR
ncbi:MAG: hypothetical protein ACSW8K_09130, partial [bacterium]